MTFHDFDNSVSKHTVFSNLRRIVENKEKPHPKAKYLFGIDKAHDGSKVRLLMNPLLSIEKLPQNFYPKSKDALFFPNIKFMKKIFYCSI